MILWRALFAGGIAGIVSRTATAPIEKIKILAQVMRCFDDYYNEIYFLVTMFFRHKPMVRQGSLNY